MSHFREGTSSHVERGTVEWKSWKLVPKFDCAHKAFLAEIAYAGLLSAYCQLEVNVWRERGLNKVFRKKQQEYFQSTASLRHDHSGILEWWCLYFLHGQCACSQLQRRLERRNVFTLLLNVHISESLRINRLFLYFCLYVFCHCVTCFCSTQGGNSIKCQEGEWAGHAAGA